jgi:hypothetical protein
MTTAVLLILYRRPQLLEEMLAVLRKARPPKLLIAADAACPSRPEEVVLCAEVRQRVLAGIDWPCEVETLFAAQHLGCRRGVTTALNWAFAKHERLIILEDDCLPDPSFFPYCEQLLELYADHRDVMQICGSNLAEMRPTEGSYYFSRFGPVWGWAGWRRAWQLYDVEMKSWPQVRASGEWMKFCPEPFEALWRRDVFDSVHSGEVDTWDYQWAYTKVMHGGLSIIPAVNLIQNTGFGAGATHTTSADAAGLLSVPTSALPEPLIAPPRATAWTEADQEYLRKIVGLPRKGLPMLRYRLGRLRRRLIQSLKRSEKG